MEPKTTSPSQEPMHSKVYYSRLNDIDESSVYDNSFIKLREVAVNYKILQRKINGTFCERVRQKHFGLGANA